jgi:hypothetical protein
MVLRAGRAISEARPGRTFVCRIGRSVKTGGPDLPRTLPAFRGCPIHPLWAAMRLQNAVRGPSPLQGADRV